MVTPIQMIIECLKGQCHEIFKYGKINIISYEPASKVPFQGEGKGECTF